MYAQSDVESAEGALVFIGVGAGVFVLVCVGLYLLGGWPPGAGRATLRQFAQRWRGELTTRRGVVGAREVRFNVEGVPARLHFSKSTQQRVGFFGQVTYSSSFRARLELDLTSLELGEIPAALLLRQAVAYSEAPPNDWAVYLAQHDESEQQVLKLLRDVKLSPFLQRLREAELTSLSVSSEEETLSLSTVGLHCTENLARTAEAGIELFVKAKQLLGAGPTPPYRGEAS